MTCEPLLDVRFALADLPKVRRRVGDCALRMGMDESRSEDFVLAAHEVMCNSVQHGGGSGRLLLYSDGTSLWCEVADRGPGFSYDGRSCAPPGFGTDDSGRGLWLARELADAVEVNRDGSGTVVTLVIGFEPRAVLPVQVPSVISSA